MTLTSRAFHNDQMGPFCKGLAELCGMEMVLPMNSGAEAVETAVKTARRWGYDVKGVPEDRAKIVTCAGNFHGRTITIVSFSTDPSAKGGFGPFTPGFETVPYGDAAALETALADPDVVAFLVEPIQGEAGVVVPPEGYLRRARELCDEHRVLLIADEIQSGLGRTGRTFACEHEGVQPDVYVRRQGARRRHRADVGGRVEARRARGVPPRRARLHVRRQSARVRDRHRGAAAARTPASTSAGPTSSARRSSSGCGPRRRPARSSEVRGKGLWIGIELTPEAAPAREVCERLMEMGVLAKDTHETTVRLAPPLCVTQEDLDWAAERILTALAERLD